jgi:hypothetical protein
MVSSGDELSMRAVHLYALLEDQPQKVANSERKSGGRWKAFAVACLLLLGAVTVWWLFSTDGTLVWQKIVMRSFVFITLLSLSTYAARQGFRHEKAERRNRILELELASLDPYLAELPEDVRTGLKQMFAERVFGRRPEEEKFEGVSQLKALLAGQKEPPQQ